MSMLSCFDLSFFMWHPDLYFFNNEFFAFRWYSLLFVLAFIVGRFIVVRSYKMEQGYDQTVDTQMIFMVLGTLFGSRMGHVLFYEPEILNRGFFQLFFFWKSGLASHGAAIGILMAMGLYSYKFVRKGIKIGATDRLRRGYNYLQVMDRMIIAVAIGCALIRMGNFVNSEIIGAPTASDFGVLFVQPVEDRIKGQLPFVERVIFEETGEFYQPGKPILNTKVIFDNEYYKENRIRSAVQKKLGFILPVSTYDYSHVINPKGTTMNYNFSRHPTHFELDFQAVGIYRHPSQLYEAMTYFFIGVVLFLIWNKHRKRLRPGSLLGLFFITAFSGRFLLEYIKENQIKNEFIFNLNLGQMLSIPFFVLGVYLFLKNLKGNTLFRTLETQL